MMNIFIITFFIKIRVFRVIFRMQITPPKNYCVIVINLFMKPRSGNLGKNSFIRICEISGFEFKKKRFI